ncbi:hypothetical protein S40293_09933 [Stachybotrys chartarum IBT 40293]|nr:hypothetical protein S40293_09933 [Stachybotrys chartarum IBT 40293]
MNWRFLFLLCCLVQTSLQQQCSQSRHCPEGCCSSAGFCGYGPDFCGQGCQSTCDRRSQCNPGWNSTEFSEGNRCPLNVCCSEHGYCGYTEEFCQDDQVERPRCSASNPVTRVIGYFEAWAPAQRSCYSMLPEEIPYGQYTDIIFSFATINPETFRVSVGDAPTEYLLSRMRSIKIIQPEIKIWVALGGWAFNDPGPTQTTFSDIAASSANTNAFLDSLVSLMNRYSLDGVDIDWEYPVAEDRYGRPGDFRNAVTFMRKLRSRMKASRRGTSMAIPASYWYLQHFNIKALEAEVDWFNLMSYDMHGSWDIDNRFTGPWANSHTNMTEIQMALDLLWRNDISPSKVTMGMAFYSRTFTLTDPSCNRSGCPISSGGNAGRCSGTVGVLLHPEIADIVAERRATTTLDRAAAVRFVSWGNQWTTFDDVATWRLKANIARSQCIQGFMVWAMSQDDERGTNIRALNSALGRTTPAFPDFTPRDRPIQPMPVTEPLLCRWTSCFEGCPAGFKEVQRDGHREIMMERESCAPYSRFNQIGFVRLCCPSSSPLPTCTWRGHRNSGNCRPGCNADEVEVGSLQTGCRRAHQSACCTRTAVTRPYGDCIWTDCVDNPQGACGARFLTQSPQGWGGHRHCRNGQMRALCCTDPLPAPFATDCKWYAKVGHLPENDVMNVCEGACPRDHVFLSRASSGWAAFAVEGSETPCMGNAAFCCPDPQTIVERDDEYEEEHASAQYARQFRELLRDYMENPTCPRNELALDIHDDRARGYGGRKRSLVVEANKYEVLRGRAEPCSETKWHDMLEISVLMFSVSYAGFDVIRRYYNDYFADSFDSELRYENLVDFFALYPNLDERAHMEYLYYNPTMAGVGMRQMRFSSQQLCTIDLAGESGLRRLAKRDPGQQPPDKRVVWTMQSDEGNNGNIPSLLLVLGGIMRGRLSLHYARWEWAEGRASNALPGPFLELAYWIGPTPGVQTTDDREYDVFRDSTSRPNHIGDDLWVVFHIHFESPGRRNDPNIRPRMFEYGPDGRTYVGTPTITVFHAQDSLPIDEDDFGNPVDWRVSGGEQLTTTARRTWQCSVPENEDRSYWFIGSPRWGRGLHSGGYVGLTGLRLIVSPPRGTGLHEPIDPDELGWVVNPEGWTEPAGNRSPYGLNFRIENGQMISPQDGPPGLLKN